MRYRLETSCMDSSWKNSRHVFFWGGELSPLVKLRPFEKIEMKGPVSWYGKLTWESAHAWNLIILCTFVAFGMTPIIMVHLIFYVIPLSIYDVMYDITTKPEGTLL